MCLNFLNFEWIERSLLFSNERVKCSNRLLSSKQWLKNLNGFGPQSTKWFFRTIGLWSEFFRLRAIVTQSHVCAYLWFNNVLSKRLFLLNGPYEVYEDFNNEILISSLSDIKTEKRHASGVRNLQFSFSVWYRIELKSSMRIVGVSLTRRICFDNSSQSCFFRLGFWGAYMLKQTKAKFEATHYYVPQSNFLQNFFLYSKQAFR